MVGIVKMFCNFGGGKRNDYNHVSLVMNNLKINK